MILIYIIGWVLFAFIAYQVLSIMILAIAGLFKRTPKITPTSPTRKYLVLIPSYKEDRIILQTAKKARELDYPQHLLEIAVIADKLQPATIAQLRNTIGVRVIEVAFQKSTKARSIKFALQQFDDLKMNFDSILILDADNFIQQDALRKMNASFDKGFMAVQLHRIAKNKNTPIAYLDAISEEINNHLFRQGMRNLGLSCAIIGSGMALDYAYFKHIYLTTSIENNPGEDKELEERLLKDGYLCDYQPDVFVLDEKVQSLDVLENQRVRWISAQFAAIKSHFVTDFSLLFTTNFNYVVKAFQYLLLPRVLLLLLVNGVAFLMVLLHLIFEWSLPYVPWYYWLILALVYNIALLISVPRYFYTKELLKAMLLLPSSMLAMGKAFQRSKFNQKEFIHTVKDFKDSSPS